MTPRSRTATGWGLVVMLAPGCADLLGPERRPTAELRGTVRLGARPLGPGWVEFWPVEGTPGDLRSAPLGPDGTFEAQRVPVGRLLVRLVLARPQTSGNPRLDAPLTRVQGFDSPLRVDVAPEGNLPVDMDLAASSPPEIPSSVSGR